MPILPGTRLGPYEVLLSVGAGGMGEVYRARDSRLGRMVAIKVLPASFASDSERLHRFELEARATASLNHPNILAVFDTGESGGSPYIVTELLEGETLGARLRSAPLPLRKATDYGVQICRGLAAAHSRNIYHRDLKPENIFLTNDGHVKILDFGLAKLVDEKNGAATDLDRAATLDPGTVPGTVLGTVGYMSPEQVRGQQTDHRSDIFSFGACLFEMLTGKPPFRRDTQADTMTAILREDPPELAQVNPVAPPVMDRIIHHCLEKKPEDRFQSASDVGFALESLSGSSPSAIVASEKNTAVARSRSRAWVLPAAVGLAALVVGGTSGLVVGRHDPAAAAPIHYRRLTFRHGPIESAKFAPDGQTIVYEAQWEGKASDLMTSRVDSPGERSLEMPNTEVLSISSAGEMAVLINPPKAEWFRPRGTLGRVPLGGGAAREILQGVGDASWNKAGSDLVVTHYIPEKNVWRIEYPIGKTIYETGAWISNVKLSPKEDQIAFLDHLTNDGDDHGVVAIVDLAGHRKTLTGSWVSLVGLAWAPAGDEVWFSAAQLGASAEIFGVTLSGKQRLLAQAPGSLIVMDIDREGRLLVNRNDFSRQVMARGPGDPAERGMSVLDWPILRDMSPDGKTLLIEEEGDGGGPNYSVYLRKLDSSAAVRLGEGRAVALSPDSQWTITRAPSDDAAPLMLIPTGAGESRQLTHDKLLHYDARWFPDGKRVLLIGAEPGHLPRNYIVNADSGDVQPLTPEGTSGRYVSPEGNWVAVTDANKKLSLWPVAGGAPRPLNVDMTGQIIAGWTADGKGLYLGYADKNVIQQADVDVLDIATGKRTLWKTVLAAEARRAQLEYVPQISSDGKTYAYSFSRWQSELELLEGLK